MEVQSESYHVWGDQDDGVKDFRELKVWQRAHELTLAVYQVTASFPREEL